MTILNFVWRLLMLAPYFFPMPAVISFTLIIIAVTGRNGQSRTPPPNSKEASIWAHPDYIKMKNDLMQAHYDESRTKAQLNRAQTLAAEAQTRSTNEQTKFWEQANAALARNNLILELRSDSHQLRTQNQSEC